jgi:hypothetical protein
MSALGSKIFTPRLANSLIDATIVAAKN